MELHTAREIINVLAQGIHPVTGEMMPPDSPYNEPPVIRALFAVSEALQQCDGPRGRREPPANAGKTWTGEDDDKLLAAFDAGRQIKQLALELGRSRVAVEARLVKLGRIEGRPGLPLRPGHQP
ncbi:hypothetical protein ACFPOE_15035 [Caenimonas terrae]|uniref:DNA binding HTH domain-containing protein n=1 Tax=Caenimonas terrae TaxID=696074 RepID=A0ABW0NET6_9BURK